MAEGWIKLSRNINSHWVFKDSEKFKWWVDMLIKVNYSDEKVLLGNTLIECKRGQSIMSLQSWAERWNTSKDRVRNFFVLLEKDGMILHENINKSTRITICNYDTYQGDLHAEPTQTQRKPNAKPTQTHPIKEYKEEIINKRKEEFYNMVAVFSNSYSKETLRSFFDYWSEPNKSNTKMKFELQKTWDIKLRLSTWSKNEIKFNTNGTNDKRITPTVGQHSAAKPLSEM